MEYCECQERTGDDDVTAGHLHLVQVWAVEAKALQMHINR